MNLPPLVRFTALAGLLFVGEHLLQGDEEETQRQVLLTRATQELLVQEESERLGRALTTQEREAVFSRWEDETLLVDDARRLGLEDGDPIVRRRLEEKMRYLLEDAASSAAASEEVLGAHLRAYPERFMLPAEVTLQQRFFARVKRGAGMDADAQEALKALRRGDHVEGDPHPLGETLPPMTRPALRRALGPVVLSRLDDMPFEVWAGPVASRDGLHLLRIVGRSASRPATLGEARAEVEASWRAHERERKLRDELDQLRVRQGLAPRSTP